MKIDYKKLQESKKAGYSDQEILEFLAENDPDFSNKLKSSREQGYSSEEVFSFLEKSSKPGKAEKTARIAGQVGLGMAESALMPYELGVAPLASKEAQQVPFRENLFSDIERLQEQKAMGQWDEQDQALYDQLIEQASRPEKSEKFIKTADIGVRGLAEKATGLDLKPEGVLEKAAHWTGFIKRPSSLKELAKLGTNPKELTKAIIPGKDALRGLGAGAALQMAEEGKFGPIGTLGAAVVGDLLGGGVARAGKMIARPKETLAKGAAALSKLSNSKNAIRADLKEASQGKEFTKDIGTLTGSNIVQVIQARLSASGLTGKPLENLRKKMTQEIVEEYESIAKELGEKAFETQHEAGQIGKEYLKRAQEADKAVHEQLYERVKSRLGPEASVKPGNAFRVSNRILKELEPGAVKSPDQQKVMSTLQKLQEDLMDAEGNIKSATVDSLINNKRALQDLVDYELQGGIKNSLKKVIQEIDKDIISYGVKDKQFLKDYVAANKQFQKHVEAFRNKTAQQIFRNEDPRTFMNRMNSVQGIRDLRKALSKTADGKTTFGELSRMKLDEIVGNNMKDGMSEQLKFGKFSNLLQKGKNNEIVKELLSPEAYRRLINLQKHAGELAQSAQKFFNASQSATAAADIATISGILSGVLGIVTGNPWAWKLPTSLFLLGRQTAKLMGDEKFLKLVEEAIQVSRKNNISLMNQFLEKMMSYLQQSVPAGIIEEDKANE